jgi:hypothetical protein
LHASRWWPIADKGVFGADATVAFDDGQLIERSADGQSDLWGTVTRWDPPHGLLAVTVRHWHPRMRPYREPAEAGGSA